MSRRNFFRLRSRLAALLALLLPLCVALAEPKVRGTLSSIRVGVGEAVAFEVAVTGGNSGSPPEVPVVDGIDISFSGQRSSTHFNLNTQDLRVEQTFTFTLVPKREGKFTIPELEVNVGGKKLKTEAVTLTVTRGETTQGVGDFAFAKIWLDRKSAYIGETVPIELRLYLDSGAHWDLRNMPPLEGDGFTTQPMGKPEQRNVEIAGKVYYLASFRTLITPSKAGKLNIGPVTSKLLVSKPSPRVDIFGSRQFGQAQEMSVEAPAVELQVNPLPAEGRPRDFSGAIGNFQFEATGTPDRVKIGEPVSMKLTIKGKGNFDRIGQPPLAEPSGWTAYSAKQQFEPTDSAGTAGTKTFELPVTPTARKNTMPVFSFSFFDPEAGKYVTLKSAAVPLTVEGEPAPLAATLAPKTTTPQQPDPKAQPKAPVVQDILPNLPELGSMSAQFGLRTSPAVLFSMMFAPLPVIAILLAWHSRRRDDSAARISALRKEKAALAERIRHSSDRAEVLDAAARLLQIETALATGQSLPGIELSQVLAARKLDAGGEDAVHELFESRNELHYAGAARNDERISSRERDRVLETLASYERTGRG